MAELRNQDHSQAFYGQDTILLSKASVSERKDPKFNRPPWRRVRRCSGRPCQAQPTRRREGHLPPGAARGWQWTAPHPSQAARPQRDPALQSGVLTGKEHSGKNLLAAQGIPQSWAQRREPGRGRDSNHNPQPCPDPSMRSQREGAKLRIPGELTEIRVNQG